MDGTNENIRIRSLLSRYYDGLTSGAERDELISLFRNSHNLPPDLETEKKVFMAIECFSSAETEAPAYLEERILKSISASERRRPLTIWLSTAAAMLVVLFMGWNAFRINDSRMEFSTTPLLPDLATLSPGQTEETTAEIPIAIPESRTEKPTPVTSPPTERKPMAHASRRQASGNRTVTTAAAVNRHRIITDQEEADLIIDRVLTIMNGKMYAAEIACDRPEIIMESINKSLAKIEL